MAGERKCIGLGLLLFTLPALDPIAVGAPYGVPLWNQHQDFTSYHWWQFTDLSDGTLSLRYKDLTSHNNVYRDPPGTGSVYDDGPVAGKSFTQADYDQMALGGWHCAPTSFGMAHAYWWNNALDPYTTIAGFAQKMDTNDVNPNMNSGDHVLHYGTYPVDQVTAAASEAPGTPWAGNYQSAILWSSGAGNPAPGARAEYFGEIRAGRPTKVGVPGHATMGVDFNPSVGPVVNDPHDASRKTYPWPDVYNFISMQPQRLPDEAPGRRVFISNDNFGTGQANAQAPAGDAGDLFGSNLDMSYGRVLDDVPDGLAPAGSGDYNAGAVTSGLQNPFDLGDIDVLITIQPMKYLTFSLDHGDPNPHDWIPGVSTGGPSYQATELTCVPAPTPYLTLGVTLGYLPGVSADEETLGLDRGEWSLPVDPLDDDVDAVELEFNLGAMAYCVDYVDTRVFPDPQYAATIGASWLLADPFWHELPGRDPTDVYGAFPVDGETTLALMDGTQLDAIQFFFDPATGQIGLLYSVNMLGDAPDMRDLMGNLLDPGMIYLSWLDGGLPIPYLGMAGDVDAITWSGMVPEPTAMMLLVLPCVLRRRRR